MKTILFTLSLSIFCFLLYGQVQVKPSVETTPVTHSNDAADDPAIWLHPTNTANSFFIGTDKKSGGRLELYDLDGTRFFNTGDNKKYNNVDVRYDFPFDGGFVDIVTVSNRTNKRIEVFRIDATNRVLVNITGSTLTQVGGDGYHPYGYAMYHNPVTNKFYGFTSCRYNISGDYPIRQWEFADDGSQKVDIVLVRELTGFTQVEGIVGDDMLGYVYIAEEDGELRKYGANPGDGQSYTVVDYVGSPTIPVDDIEGLTLYYASKNEGYLMASWQGGNDFLVYDRISNGYIGSFEVIANPPIGAVSQTDGIDVISCPLGAAFPKGAFICHDGQNGTYSNFKVVSWDSIAVAFGPNLVRSTVVNPRAMGKPAITWTGNNSADWNSDGNWDAGAVPFDYNDVIIPDVTTFDPQISIETSCNSLTLLDGATLTLQNGASLTVKNDVIRTLKLKQVKGPQRFGH